ncbi:MAG: thymidine phosphorylase [Clostridia bacterium]|nr:thymidine phosphorylase [Clostridia bacterium]
MRVPDIIRKKRDGLELSPDEIKYFISGYTSGDIPDYQASALLMAVFLRGMTDRETVCLTEAIRDSGTKPDFSGIKGIRVDKHSTGGVGDKTSLIVGPIVAACGMTVAKISGRGLGHTGGTVDKLEAIPGYRTALSGEEFSEIVNRTGIAIVGQSSEIAPADKKLYALRDVTSTVESLPLIASSIMGKKLAAGDDVILLDVKTGSGSFLKSVDNATALARVMVNIGKAAGKKTAALITDMDSPLGNEIGNANEVREAVGVLKGKGPDDLTYLCRMLSSGILSLAGCGSDEKCLSMVDSVLYGGKAFEKLIDMVEAQGGDPGYIEDPSRLGRARFTAEFTAERDGYISGVNAEGYGKASLLLGAGREKLTDAIDPLAGISLIRKRGDRVSRGEPVAVLMTDDKSRIPAAVGELSRSTFYSDEAPSVPPMILGKVD